MDDRQFDALVKTLGSRRRVLLDLGVTVLAGLGWRFVSTEDAAAKKKHGKKKKKKCKAGTRACNGGCIPLNNCCVDSDCGPNQTCTGGQCVAVQAPLQCQNTADCSAGQVCQNGVCVVVNVPQCQVDGDCGAGQRCQNGQCVADVECQVDTDCGANESCLSNTCQCTFPNKPCGDLCCASDRACVNGTCVVGKGTCTAGDDICASDDVTCNGNASCICGIRLDDGEPRCIQFVNDSRTICTCNNDFRCEQISDPARSASRVARAAPIAPSPVRVDAPPSVRAAVSCKEPDQAAEMAARFI